MRCPVCNAKDTRVLDSRLSSDEASVRRRRECIKCRFRFSTVEDIQILDLTVCKRDGRREPYSQEKMVRGIDRALEKRPITHEQHRQLIRGIETAIQKNRASEITTRDIGEIIMKQLERFDHVAYIRFASVYRQFEDVKTFQREIARLKPIRHQQSIKTKKKKR